MDKKKYLKDIFFFGAWHFFSTDLPLCESRIKNTHFFHIKIVNRQLPVTLPYFHIYENQGIWLLEKRKSWRQFPF